jgi:hypothetical protein
MTEDTKKGSEFDALFERADDTKPVEQGSALDRAHAAGFPQPTETFEDKCRREGPAAIQRAIDSAKK